MYKKYSFHSKKKKIILENTSGKKKVQKILLQKYFSFK